MQLTRLTQYRDVCEKNGPLTPGLPLLQECNYSSQPNSAHLGRSLSHTHTLPKTLFDVLPHSLKDFPGNSSWFINNLPPQIIFTLGRKCQSFLHTSDFYLRTFLNVGSVVYFFGEVCGVGALEEVLSE